MRACPTGPSWSRSSCWAPRWSRCCAASWTPVVRDRVYGGGPSMEDFTGSTPLTVGSPEQVVERYLTMADSVGDYQRQMFLMDHAGLPHRTVMEQIELLGTEVVPVLRRELDARRPADVPGAPTHAQRVAESESLHGAFDDTYRFETGDNWTGLRAEDSRDQDRLSKENTPS